MGAEASLDEPYKEKEAIECHVCGNVIYTNKIYVLRGWNMCLECFRDYIKTMDIDDKAYTSKLDYYEIDE